MREAAAASSQAAEAAQTSPTVTALADRWDGLRQAAQALLDTWDELTCSDRNIFDPLTGAAARLRAALASRASVIAPIDASRAPKNTKQAQILAMLRRDEGASGPQIGEAMGWAPHTVRGFLAGLTKKGIKVEVRERVRQVGSNKAGAKGSYTVYRLAAAL